MESLRPEADPAEDLFTGGTLRAVTGATIRPGGLALTDRGVALAGFAPGDRVLDAGCGPGATVEHLRARHGLRALGADRSAALLAEGRRAAPEAPLCRAEAARLPFRDAAFDGVLCECVLTLTADPAATLAELFRVLRRGGRLVLTDMYARDAAGLDLLRALPRESCLQGATTREENVARVEAAGFVPSAWEDHTRELRELTVRLIFAGAGEGTSCCAQGPGAGYRAAAPARPGYFLLVARKP